MSVTSNCARINTNKENKFRIICFCHAGGHSAQYSSWHKLLPRDVECIIYDRPGSGTRMGQDPLNDWQAIIEDTWHELKSFLDLPYVLFGHSLGGSIAFEFCKLVQAKSINLPKAIFIGDREAPVCPPSKIRYNLSDELFKQVLAVDYEMDEQVLNNNDLMEFFMPILRNDFKLADIYYDFYKVNGQAKINSPIFVFRPDDTLDPLSEHMAWKDMTNKGFNLLEVRGGHFFNFDNPQETINTMTNYLKTS